MLSARFVCALCTLRAHSNSVWAELAGVRAVSAPFAEVMCACWRKIDVEASRFQPTAAIQQLLKSRCGCARSFVFVCVRLWSEIHRNPTAVARIKPLGRSICLSLYP